MVVLPLFGDQPANAMKVHEAGIGVILDLQNLTPNAVTNAILEVLRNSSYKEKAERVSRLIRHRRVTPTEEACDWIEYGLHNNAGLHLRSEADNLYFFQVYLLDVLLLIVATVVCVMVLFYFCLKYCLQHIIQKCSKKSKSD